jgi:hypothetical protein
MKFPEWVVAWFARKAKDDATRQAQIEAESARFRYATAVPHECDKAFWEMQPGRDSNMTAEARYGCPVCDKGEFRGGWGSSLWLEQ